MTRLAKKSRDLAVISAVQAKFQKRFDKELALLEVAATAFCVENSRHADIMRDVPADLLRFVHGRSWIDLNSNVYLQAESYTRAAHAYICVRELSQGRVRGSKTSKVVYGYEGSHSLPPEYSDGVKAVVMEAKEFKATLTDTLAMYTSVEKAIVDLPWLKAHLPAVVVKKGALVPIAQIEAANALMAGV